MNFIKRSNWSVADCMAAIVTVLGLSVFFAGHILGAIEGRFLPVASNFKIEKSYPAGNAATRVWGEFLIVRPGCDFYGLEWWLEGSTRSVLVPVVFEEGSKVRAGGRNEFNSWLLSIAEVQLPQSRVEVIHECPMRPWRTRTILLRP